MDSAGELKEEKSASVGSLLFEDTEKNRSGSAGDSEEDKPDPRVQEEVCSRNDDISNSIKICDFLKLV